VKDVTPPFPFSEVSRRDRSEDARSLPSWAGGAKTSKPDRIRWRGVYEGELIEFVSQPRNPNTIDHFVMSSSQRLRTSGSEAPNYIDVSVRTSTTWDEAKRRRFAALLADYDDRPARVRLVGEPLAAGVGA
jgi:hypothetical protein